ncbi:hypothetical protein DEU56DRAFT_737574 [Suillus clintonianus]|uniref:uncharacterized protein n=1 Tax=Suillus clintonianus TaxID=1904413 RepID=UPI001B882727|nr:uncharacterized protein DEU56DRAFT_737574 [Suillus clintonianus]KAG2135813.1 hypothetical protein DEU56DRAFT_737574 [Suillus clintonianus]
MLDPDGFLPTDGEGPEKFTKTEQRWANNYEWLKTRGYLLRPRYAPNWVPSWKGEKKPKPSLFYEDGQMPFRSSIMDATRLSDNTYVILKLIQKSVHPYEVEIGQHLCSEALAADPANHCVPTLDVLQLPDEEDLFILIIPLLRYYINPPFKTFGEAVECFRQLFEGLQFMHSHRVAHRDCMSLNIMMDADLLYKGPFHPMQPVMRRDFKGYAKHYTRTQRPVKYLYIDFGISRRYDPSEAKPTEIPIFGGDKRVPEFQNSNEPRDPFPTDVWYLGRAIQQDFLLPRKGFEFMKELIDDMVQDDPAKRPSMDEVVSRYEVISKGLSTWKLRSRVKSVNENSLTAIFRGVVHWSLHLQYLLRRLPAIPTYRPDV